LLTGIAAAQLAGEDFLTGLSRHRADAAGQQITPVPGLSSTTAAGVARRVTPAQWLAVETGVATVTGRMLALLPADRAAALTTGPVTLDLDTTDVEVYGRKKRGVAYNHQGQRVGRPHVATWAEAEIVLAADLGSGTDDPRATAAGLLRRALACLPAAARAGGRVALRADAGYFAGQLARAARDEHIAFAIGAKRIAPLWRLLAGIGEQDWADATGMDHAQVAVAEYCPDWWPATTRLLIRRVRLDPAQVSADPRSRRHRTLHPDQRALPISELVGAGVIYGYSFILTNLDASARIRPPPSTATGTAPRRRTSSATASTAPRYGTSGYVKVNMAWMWGALLAACMAAWLHQLTAVTVGEDILAGHGVRGGKAMIATLRWRLIAVRPARASRPAADPAAAARPPPARRGPRPPPGTARPVLTATPARPGTWNPRTRRDTPGITPARAPEATTAKASAGAEDQLSALLAESGLTNRRTGSIGGQVGFWSSHAVESCGLWSGEAGESDRVRPSRLTSGSSSVGWPVVALGAGRSAVLRSEPSRRHDPDGLTRAAATGHRGSPRCPG